MAKEEPIIDYPKGIWYPSGWVCRCTYCGEEVHSDRAYVTMRCSKCNKIFKVEMHCGTVITESRDYLI
jgi:hypothetical protein